MQQVLEGRKLHLPKVAPLAVNRPEYPAASFFACGEEGDFQGFSRMKWLVDVKLAGFHDVGLPRQPGLVRGVCSLGALVSGLRDVRSDATSVVFGCGENGSGQCGRSMHQQQQADAVALHQPSESGEVWSQVRLPKHSRVDQLRCGQAHCLALLKDGRLFAWGGNPQGQVGNGVSVRNSWCRAGRRTRLDPRIPKARG